MIHARYRLNGIETTTAAARIMIARDHMGEALRARRRNDPLEPFRPYERRE
jgi:hypothetical protein